MEAYEKLGMTNADVIDAISSNLGTMLSMMQFWMTATFALIIAFHFAGNTLTRSLGLLATLLYLQK